jgi:hypothetical protein
MQPHEERVVAEKRELDDKIDKIYEFLYSETAEGLKEADAVLLVEQHHVMRLYSAVLGQRIARFVIEIHPLDFYDLVDKSQSTVAVDSTYHQSKSPVDDGIVEFDGKRYHQTLSAPRRA